MPRAQRAQRPEDAAANGIPDPSGTDRQFVTALARGLAVLRCFGPRTRELGTTEIAALTGLPQPTVWRLCHTLQKLGYLMAAPSGDKLRIGMGVLGLGQFALGNATIGELVQPELQRIATLTNAAVSLGVPDQSDILITQRAVGGGPLFVDAVVGSRLPMATTAAGWAYLAVLPDALREEAFSRLRAGPARQWKLLREHFDDAHATFARTGFILNLGHFMPEVNSIGAPVLDAHGQLLYVLNCGGPASSLKEKTLRDDIGPRLVALAHRISTAASAPTGLPRTPSAVLTV